MPTAFLTTAIPKAHLTRTPAWTPPASFRRVVYTPSSGMCRSAPAQATMTAAPSCGYITRITGSPEMSTQVLSDQWLSHAEARRARTAAPKTWPANLQVLNRTGGGGVRWDGMTRGGQANFPTPHWQGNVVTVDKPHTDIFSILPAQFVTADMVPDRVGTWMFHCHIDEHMEGGMMAMYQVLP